jgi:hypothetical protein
MRHLSARLTALAAAGALALLGLLGCASTPASVPTSTAPTEPPVFASDEEALAAATSAYAAYLAMSDRISNEGGAAPERIATFVSAALLPSELQGFSAFMDAKAHTVGSTSFRIAKLQSADYKRIKTASIAAYVCEDVSAVDVVDGAGASLVSPDRKPLTPFEVRMVMGEKSTLVLDGRTVWEGESFC